MSFTSKINDLKEQGFCIIPKVLTNQECSDYISLLTYYSKRFANQYAGRGGKKTEHNLDDKANESIVYNLHNKDESFLKLMDHPKVFPIIKSALQEGSYMESEPVIYQQSSARTPHKDAEKQQLHIDSRYPGAPFCLSLTCLYCLEDFTNDTGATRVIPSSHRRQSYPENGVAYDDEIQLEAPAGSVIIINGGLWHASGKNYKEETRWAAIYSFSRWFYKPSFDFKRNTPQEVFDRCTEQQKELLGFKFNPAIDEFERINSRSETFERPVDDYNLPN